MSNTKKIQTLNLLHIRKICHQKLENSSASFFSKYHKYMEVIVSEQGALLKELNNFINDLMTLK
jgi:hypothetical protein